LVCVAVVRTQPRSATRRQNHAASRPEKSQWGRAVSAGICDIFEVQARKERKEQGPRSGGGRLFILRLPRGQNELLANFGLRAGPRGTKK
jgi:hypothetical protein